MEAPKEDGFGDDFTGIFVGVLGLAGVNLGVGAELEEIRGAEDAELSATVDPKLCCSLGSIGLGIAGVYIEDNVGS